MDVTILSLAKYLRWCNIPEMAISGNMITDQGLEYSFKYRQKACLLQIFHAAFSAPDQAVEGASDRGIQLQQLLPQAAGSFPEAV